MHYSQDLSPIKTLLPSEIPTWIREELYNPSRQLPIVVSTTTRDGKFPIPPEDVQHAIQGQATLVLMEDGTATRVLKGELPDKHDVYDGCLRIYWPGFNPSSYWKDHRLIFTRWPDVAREPDSVLTELVQELKGGGVHDACSTLSATVVRTDCGVTLRTDEFGLGELVAASVPIPALAICLQPGSKMKVQLSGTGPERAPEYSAKNTLASTWELVSKSAHVGDVLEGRVSKVMEDGVLIDLLPGARGICHLSEVDCTFVSDISKFVDEGEIVPVKVLSLHPDQRRADLSIAKATLEIAQATLQGGLLPSPSLVPDGIPFQWGRYVTLTTRVKAPEGNSGNATDDSGECESCDRWQAQNAELQIKLKKEHAKGRRAESRLESLESRFFLELDPLESERSFCQAIRIEHARKQGEGDRFAYPLMRMTMAAQFLETCKTIEGVSPGKIVEVSAQTACGRVNELGSRAVHRRRAGPGGSNSITRERDGAVKMQVNLQTGTPGARRLHYWLIPAGNSGKGPSIEFESVRVHD